MHHITARPSFNTSSLFTKAIAQSPAFQPITNAQETATFEETLLLASKLTNKTIATLAELKAVPSLILYEVNVLLVASSEYGTFTFGSVVDGNLVPALPGTQLLNGIYDHNLSLIAGHNQNEGIFFTSPSIRNNFAFTALVESLLPDATPETIDYVTNVLYPPVFNGSYPYATQQERGALITE